MNGYLVMCATNADDLILQRFAGKEQAEEYAMMISSTWEMLKSAVRIALEKLDRDWSDPVCVYIACIGESEISYDFLEDNAALMSH